MITIEELKKQIDIMKKKKIEIEIEEKNLIEEKERILLELQKMNIDPKNIKEYLKNMRIKLEEDINSIKIEA